MHPSRLDYQGPLIRFINVSKSFKGKKIIDNLSFDIYPGELFGLIGQSGAGKTTLLRILIGYYKADSGTILYNGKDITKNLEIIRKIFGFTTQESCFYEELSPCENIKYFSRMYGVEEEDIKRKTERLLGLVGLLEHKDKPAKKLSGGQQRRLDLALSLIHNPEVLILDEPTTGLDPLLRKSMWALIQKINTMGVTVVMSSHLLDEMEYLCHAVAMIKDGKLLVKGTPDELKSFYSRNQEVSLESYPGNYRLLIDALQKAKVPVFYPRHETGNLIFYTPNPTPILKALPSILNESKELLIEIKIEKPNLSEVFEALTNYHK